VFQVWNINRFFICYYNIYHWFL